MRLWGLQAQPSRHTPWPRANLLDILPPHFICRPLSSLPMRWVWMGGGGVLRNLLFSMGVQIKMLKVCERSCIYLVVCALKGRFSRLPGLLSRFWGIWCSETGTTASIGFSLVARAVSYPFDREGAFWTRGLALEALRPACCWQLLGDHATLRAHSTDV